MTFHAAHCLLLSQSIKHKRTDGVSSLNFEYIADAKTPMQNVFQDVALSAQNHSGLIVTVVGPGVMKNNHDNILTDYKTD